MVCYNKHEYLQHDVFSLERSKKINCIMKKFNLFLLWFDTKSINVCNMMYSLWSNKKIFFKKEDISVTQKYSTAVMHTWGRLPLLPVFGTIFQKYTKFWKF